jgi:HEAT repeat protein
MLQANRDQAPIYQTCVRLSLAPSLKGRGRECADALLALGREIRQATERAYAEACVDVGRRLATPEALEVILDRAPELAGDVESLAMALRFRGPPVLEQVLERVHGSSDLAARRALFDVAARMGEFPELGEALATRLLLSLSDSRWFVVRNAIQLLAMTGRPLPQERLWELARAEHRQVRLALAQVIAKWKQSPDGLDLLTALLEDQDAGVRFTAAVALGRYAHPRARQSLSKRVGKETDPETRAACEAALNRRVVALKSA